MITFHEGLPGAGKSYEAMVKHIIPNIKKGRKIFAYIEGLNHEKIAELCEISTSECESLLIQISREEVLNIPILVDNDSFVIIDELQNFFAAGRQRLDDTWTQFVTEHRHRGIDILTMGQSLADCHNLWKRRTETKLTFTKLSAVGRSKSYRWEAYKAQLTSTGNPKYIKIRSGVEKYDEKYFGSYSSHTSDTSNTAEYLDSRTNIFNSSIFKFVIPVFLVVVIYAINHLLDFFSPPENDVPLDSQDVSINDKPPPNQPSLDASELATAESSTQTSPAPIKQTYLDYFDELFSNNRVRLTGVVQYELDFEAFIEVSDKSYNLLDQVNTTELTSIGWSISLKHYGLIIKKDTASHLIRYVKWDSPYSPPTAGNHEQVQQ
jgi:zona occludens toxin